MKQLYMVAARIRYYFRNSKTVFVLFIVGGIINTILVTYCYGNILPTITNRNSTSIARREYSVLFGGEFSSLTQQAVADKKDIQKLQNSSLIQAYMIKTAEGIGTYYGEYPFVRINGNIVFDGTSEIIVPAMEDAQLDDKVFVGSEIFRVIGTVSDSKNTYLISNEDFTRLEMNDCVKSIFVVASTDKDASASNVMKYLKSVFPYASYVGGDAQMLSIVDRQGTEYYAILISFAGLAAIISQAFLLENLLKKAQKYNAIQRIVGYSRFSIVQQNLLETFLLEALPSIVGILTHKLLYGLFERLNITPDISYYLSDYFIIFMFMFVLSVIILVPLSIYYTLATPIKTRKRLSE